MTFCLGILGIGRSLEARSDVLVFTSPRLSREIDIAGYPIVSLVFSSDLPTADVVVRLCDVHPRCSLPLSCLQHGITR